ncbi:MAG: hypothetical protein HRJ53_25485 [Acidobacteria bacterium Pan2503]|uniref:Uncharacterized protein n=1 Tax=Candidatus Acidiferrum panamense TaxID=2741543 RepID=A0A7V8T031_9BACT|nr:hypothetical protein [Candidatus Acidoferrum panamensis]
MSTGENLNANGAVLTEDMVRKGFFRFPQSVEAHLPSAQYAHVGNIQMGFAYPFTVIESDAVPFDEVWYVDDHKALVGRIVNVALSAPKIVTTK